MTDRTFDAVFLDVGGVLLWPDFGRVAQALHEAPGGPRELDDGDFPEAHYRGMAANDAAAADAEMFDAYHVAFLDRLGLAQDAEAAVALRSVWGPHLWHRPIPGAREALATLVESGLPVVIVSNADGTVDRLLRIGEMAQVGEGVGVPVRAIVDSGAVGVAKPDPRIFEMALEHVGVPAARTVHVGDSHHYDVRGAQAAGIHPVLVDPFDLHVDESCHRVPHLQTFVDDLLT